VITTPSADWKALRAAYGALVKLFGDGWMAGQAEQMADVFTSNGVLVPGPFDAPVKGRSAIAEYWKDIPLDQAEISFRFGEIYVAGPWFATEFRCTFRRRRTGKFVDVKGAIFCETSEGKIAEMRMYWQRVSAR
jgi:ketosteroid isomerase-like protein